MTGTRRGHGYGLTILPLALQHGIQPNPITGTIKKIAVFYLVVGNGWISAVFLELNLFVKDVKVCSHELLNMTIH
jgi:hypothetical protein